MARIHKCFYLTCGFGFGSVFTVLFFLTRGSLDEGTALFSEASNAYNISSHSPLIFVGGFPRSGTTLMRILLDTHPEVRCGPETRVIPRVLYMRDKWFRSPAERKRLLDAHLLGEPIDRAVAAFVLEIMRRNGPLAPRLCNKDPLALKHLQLLAKYFPNAKFVLMLRDGRAVAHSVMKRTVTITGIDWSNPWDILKHWNAGMKTMMNQCVAVGSRRCFAIKYEDLVLQPERWLRNIVSFLNLSWSPNLLRHRDVMKNNSALQLSKSEKSTDQVVRPINIKALTEWCHDQVLPKDFIYRSHLKAPMLAQLGYDVEHVPPYYGVADPLVKHNTDQLRDDS